VRSAKLFPKAGTAANGLIQPVGAQQDRACKRQATFAREQADTCTPTRPTTAVTYRRRLRGGRVGVRIAHKVIESNQRPDRRK